MVVAAAILFFMISVATENKFADISSYRMLSSSIIYASNGETIASFGYHQRKIIPLKSVARIAIDAVVATEDSRFFEHGPIDFKGILRALVSDIISGKFSEGGSTITQQLVKNIFLSPEKSIYRKTVEVVLAYKMENRYSKKKILELYLNEIYFGNGSYGIEDAAERYFGVSASHLNLLESAALAGVIEAPSRYNLYRHPRLARERISHVLKRMYELDKITEKQYQNALNGNLKLRSKSIPSWAYG